MLAKDPKAPGVGWGWAICWQKTLKSSCLDLLSARLLGEGEPFVGKTPESPVVLDLLSAILLGEGEAFFLLELFLFVVLRHPTTGIVPKLILAQAKCI